MGLLVNVASAVLVIGIMIVCCYFTSGISNVAGTIFEHKSSVDDRHLREAADQGTVRGGRRQTT